MVRKSAACQSTGSPDILPECGKVLERASLEKSLDNSAPWEGPVPALETAGEHGVSLPANHPLDAAAIRAVLDGETNRFEEIVIRHSPRLFGLVRKYSRRESDVADLVQDVFVRAYRRLDSWRGDAPFEHWLTRLTIHVCYDYLRQQRRRPEEPLADITDDETAWLEHHGQADHDTRDSAAAARSLVEKVLTQLSPPSRMIIELLEIEDRSVKEISALLGWSVSVVKVRAFRARAEMRRIVELLDCKKYL